MAQLLIKTFSYKNMIYACSLTGEANHHDNLSTKYTCKLYNEILYKTKKKSQTCYHTFKQKRERKKWVITKISHHSDETTFISSRYAYMYISEGSPKKISRTNIMNVLLCHIILPIRKEEITPFLASDIKIYYVFFLFYELLPSIKY